MATHPSTAAATPTPVPPALVEIAGDIDHRPGFPVPAALARVARVAGPHATFLDVALLAVDALGPSRATTFSGPASGPLLTRLTSVPLLSELLDHLRALPLQPPPTHAPYRPDAVARYADLRISRLTSLPYAADLLRPRPETWPEFLAPLPYPALTEPSPAVAHLAAALDPRILALHALDHAVRIDHPTDYASIAGADLATLARHVSGPYRSHTRPAYGPDRLYLARDLRRPGADQAQRTLQLISPAILLSSFLLTPPPTSPPPPSAGQLEPPPTPAPTG